MPDGATWQLVALCVAFFAAFVYVVIQEIKREDS